MFYNSPATTDDVQGDAENGARPDLLCSDVRPLVSEDRSSAHRSHDTWTHGSRQMDRQRQRFKVSHLLFVLT